MSDILIPKKRIIQPNIKPNITAILNTDHQLAQGLAGCWPFNEGGGLSVYDHSGNDNHGVLTGGATWTASRDGGAVQLRYNTAQHILMPYAPNMNLLDAEATISLRGTWNDTELNRGIFLARYNSATGRRIWNVGLLYGEATAYFDDDGSDYNLEYLTASDAVYVQGDQFHIAATCAGGTISVYTDGVLVATNSSGPSSIDSDSVQPIHIGSTDAAEMRRITGTAIEQATVYSRAFTADEIAWLHAEPYAMFEYPTDRYISLPTSSLVTEDKSYNADIMLTVNDEAYEADIAIGASMREDWGAMWPIEINANSVISSDVTDWPCLITDIHFTEEAWQYIQSDGRDLRFTSDEYGVLELYFDLVRIDVANKSAHIYVRIPNLNSDSNTTIYAWVGNAEATAPSAAWMQNTYPADVAAWWPMEEGAGTTVGDRTANARHATDDSDATGWTTVAGEIAIESTATDGKFYPWGTAPLGITNQLTVLARFWRSSNDFGHLVSRHASPTLGYGWGLNQFNGKLTFSSSTTGYNWAEVTYNTVLTTGQVYNVAAVYNGTTVTLYVDGVAAATGSRTGNIYEGAGVTGRLLSSDNSDPQALPGGLVQAGIRTTARSADEIALHHLMLSSPATFATAGDIEIIIPIYSADVDIKGIQDTSCSADIKLVKDINYNTDVMIEPLPALLIPRRKVIQPNQKPDIGVQLNTDHPLAQGLVGYWLMNEGTGNITQDLSGNSKHAAFYNSTTWRTGQLGSLYFDGSNDYIAADEAVITGATDATWVVRAYIPRQYIGIRNCVIMSQRTGGNGYTFCWSMDLSSYDATGRCRFYDRTWSDNINLYSQSEIWNAWHTIVVRRRGIVFDIFIDGQLDNTGAAPTIVDYQNWRWSMGWSLRESNYATVMLADFAAVYKRALSDEQIVTLQFEPYSMLKYPTKRYISITQDIGPTRNISYLSDTVKIKEDNDTSYSADILLQIETDVFYNSDVILRTEHNISYSSDVIPQKQETENYYADIIARTQNDISYEADTLAQEQEIVIYYTDIGVRGTIDVTYSSEGLLQKQSDISYSAEADVIVIREYYANIYMTKTNNVILYFADVILKVLNNSLSYAADSAIYNIFSSTYSSDIYIREARYSLVDTLARKVLSLNNIEAGASSIEMSAASGTEDTVEAVREDNTVNIIAFNTEYIEIILSMKSTSTTTIPEEAESHSLQIEAAVNILEKTTINEVNATRTAVPDGTEVVFEVEGEDSVNAMVNPITAKTNAGKAETSLVVITPIGTDKVDVTVRAYLNQF